MIDLYVKLCAKMCDKKGGGIAETLSFLHTHTHTYKALAEKNSNNLLVTENIASHTKSFVWDFLCYK